ncbi:MAG: GreA/GreB family elongation factor [Planctomycetota bacterium]|nr:GreA/GreB family elongation factor [Planctomycetota bacterium]
MARWDDLRRAITARDTDATERIWFELLEANPQDPSPFLELADLQSRQTGGKRLAGSLLGLLVDDLKSKERWQPLLPVLAKLATISPDEGSLRSDAVEAAQKAAPERTDLDHLLDQSGVQGGGTASLADQIRMLERLLEIEPDAWVFHKSGWGVGQIVEYDADRGKCVIDFRTRPGHEMAIEAAARLLDRLAADDIRVQAMADPKALRKRAKAEPLEMVRQVLARYNNRCPLRNVREALVPDAVATSTWSTWWKEAKKHALLDPRFDVGPGRDPRIEFHDIAQADFQAQVDRALKSEATAVGRQKAVMELFKVVGSNDEAKVALREAVEKELNLTRRAADRVGWVIARGTITGENFNEELASALLEAEDPVAIVSSIEDDKTRVEASRALVKAGEEGPDKLMNVIMRDDAAGARVAGETFSGLGRPELFEELLDKIEARPAQLPNLYAWYCRGLVRDRWISREYDPAALMLRVLKVMDAVEFRQRKGSDDKDADVRDKAAVQRLVELLTEKNCALAVAASKSADEDQARHMIKMLGQNRALKGRSLERLQDSILRDHPGALKDATEEEIATQIYMTADGIQRWRADFDRITNDEMPANAKEIARAREFGDLSENAEYHAAREKQSLLQAKANELKASLARAVVIRPEIIRTDAVSVGSRVRLKDAGGEEITYTLFGPPDADVAQGIINYQTPLGQALMGRATGESVRLEIGGKVRELTVLGIESGMATSA